MNAPNLPSVPNSSDSRAELDGQEKGLEESRVRDNRRIADQLTESLRRRRPRVTSGELSALGCLSLLLAPLILAIALNGALHGALVAFIPTFLLIALTQSVVTKKCVDKAHRLMCLAEVRTVGTIVELLAWPDPGVQRDAEESLTRLLPRLMASDSHLLNSRQRSILYRHLYGSNVRFVLAILRALEQVGDERALPHIERQAGLAPLLPDDRKIQTAASDCLTILRQRLDWTGQTLLRPADSSANSEESLLRPAGDSAQAGAERLLRPADSNRETL